MNVTGFVFESLVAVRKTALHSSEMVSQLMFGDMVMIQEHAYGWYKVKGLEDGYTGWVPSTMVEPVSEAFMHPRQPFKLVKDLVAPLRVKRRETESVVYLTKGARFPLMTFAGTQDDTCTRLLRLGELEFRIAEEHLTDPLGKSVASIVETAKGYLNVPYLWGGKSPFGADCSGYLQTVFKLHGIRLLRDSHQQATQGTAVTYADREAGDLAFFKGASGNIMHVGLLMNRDTIIHASGRVRIDKFTPEGIYSIDLRTLSHRLHSLRNVLG
jgi:gamma-D-glutamyl-L-lysine dipeptidyl-peptidase